MVWGKSLPKVLKEKIINGLTSGESISEVSRRLDIPKQTIYSIKKQFLQRGHLENVSKSGQPKKTTIRKDRKIRRLSVADLRKTAADIRV